MSYAHADCARQILKLLSKPGDKRTRSELNSAVKYHGKNETNFGATLVDLVQGGLLEENRIHLQPTQYIRTDKQVAAAKAPMPLKMELPSRRAGKTEALRQELAAAEKAGSKVIIVERPPRPHAATPKPRLVNRTTRVGADTERAMQRRALIVDALGKAPLLATEISGATGSPRVTLSNDLTWLKKKGYIRFTPDATRRGNVYSLTDKTFEAPAAVAPAAEPARAPAEAAAPTGAADLAASLDFQAVEVALQDAHARAIDARTAYIRTRVDEFALAALDASIEATKNALHIHRQGRSA